VLTISTAQRRARRAKLAGNWQAAAGDLVSRPIPSPPVGSGAILRVDCRPVSTPAHCAAVAERQRIGDVERARITRLTTRHDAATLSGDHSNSSSSNSSGDQLYTVDLRVDFRGNDITTRATSTKDSFAPLLAA